LSGSGRRFFSPAYPVPNDTQSERVASWVGPIDPQRDVTKEKSSNPEPRFCSEKA
jgi:hypothetical protein